MMRPLNCVIVAWDACIAHPFLSIGFLLAVVFLIVAGPFSDD